jgi:hypothetical protein
MLVRGACCGTHCAPAALRSDNRSKSDHKGVCPAAHATPRLALLGTGKRAWQVSGHRCARPPGSQALRAALARPSAAMARVLSNPFWLRLRRGVCGVGMRVAARMLRPLTRRGCPNGAAQQRSEFHGAPRKRPDAGLPRSAAQGPQTVGRLFLVTFFWRSKRKLLRRRAHIPASTPQQKPTIKTSISKPTTPPAPPPPHPPQKTPATPPAYRCAQTHPSPA